MIKVAAGCEDSFHHQNVTNGLNLLIHICTTRSLRARAPTFSSRPSGLWLCPLSPLSGFKGGDCGAQGFWGIFLLKSGPLKSIHCVSVSILWSGSSHCPMYHPRVVRGNTYSAYNKVNYKKTKEESLSGENRNTTIIKYYVVSDLILLFGSRRRWVQWKVSVMRRIQDPNEGAELSNSQGSISNSQGSIFNLFHHGSLFALFSMFLEQRASYCRNTESERLNPSIDCFCIISHCLS